MQRIPEEITHDEFLAALQPLLDLLNVDPRTVYPDIVITGNESSPNVLSRILLTGATPAEDAPTGAMRYPGGPQENSIHSWRATVNVVLAKSEEKA